MTAAKTLDLASARDYIAKVRWQFAKTMPQWPHWYTARQWNPDLESEFEAVATLIRETGVIKPWPRTSTHPKYHHTYLTIDGYEYLDHGCAHIRDKRDQSRRPGRRRFLARYPPN